jgi:hypothetical protein
LIAVVKVEGVRRNHGGDGAERIAHTLSALILKTRESTLRVREK